MQIKFFICIFATELKRYKMEKIKKKETFVSEKEETFEEFLEEIKFLVKKSNKKQVNYALSSIYFKENEILPNIEYFRFCYNFGDSPESALIRLPEHENELFRKIDNFSDKNIKKEFNSRELDADLSNVDIDSLLEELNNRSFLGNEYGKIEDFNTQTLINELADRNDANLLCVVAQHGKFRQTLGQLLNISNDFAYTDDELIELVKEKLNK